MLKQNEIEVFSERMANEINKYFDKIDMEKLREIAREIVKDTQKGP